MSDKNQIIDRVHEVYEMAEAVFNRRFDLPMILFKKRGRTAATANSGRNELNFNMVLFRENRSHFLAQTVPHEIAHLIAHEIYKGYISPHGKEWRYVMIKLGAEPKRCHSYDTTNAAAYHKAKYVYKCGCNLHVVGPVVHKKINRGVKYTCNSCKSKLTFIREAGHVSYKEALKQ